MVETPICLQANNLQRNHFWHLFVLHNSDVRPISTLTCNFNPKLDGFYFSRNYLFFDLNHCSMLLLYFGAPY